MSEALMVQEKDRADGRDSGARLPGAESWLYHFLLCGLELMMSPPCVPVSLSVGWGLVVLPSWGCSGDSVRGVL